jgi:hypothetical protein
MSGPIDWVLRLQTHGRFRPKKPKKKMRKMIEMAMMTKDNNRGGGV